MRKILKLISVIMAAVLAAGVFAGCLGESREPERVVELLDNDSIMERYFNAVEDFDHVEYEQIYFNYGRTDGLGPHEYRFRGIVYLTDEEAQRIWDAYEWEEADPEFEFDKVDTSAIGDGPWYSCREFESDNYSIIVPYYTVFDGQNLVFDIHQI